MMNYRYKHLSPGYVGVRAKELTLNSQFYSYDEAFLSEEEIILFPQRVPRAGFFDELYKLETTYFKIKFNTELYSCKSSLKNFSKIHSTRQWIKWGNICLRYGKFKEIIDSSANISNACLEILLLKEAATVELQLSNDLPVSANNYLKLAQKYTPSKNISDREKILLLNHLIVTSYRHDKNQSNQKFVYLYANTLRNLLIKFENDTFMNQLYCSVGYRGLAMVSEFGQNMQAAYLQKSESLATNLRGLSAIENIISLENQYTCFQTMAKWHQHNGDTALTESYLNKMIQIDPYDSTGYSELGFHFVNIEDYKNASANFKKAMELGPPGTGMNAYYYAKCLEILGMHDEAIENLFKSTELDDQGISPWLDLAEYYVNQYHESKAIEIASHILNSPTLFEQLEKNEIIKLQNIIN